MPLIDILLIEDILGFDGTLALTCEFEEWDFLNVGNELLECQGLVVDG